MAGESYLELFERRVNEIITNIKRRKTCDDLRYAFGGCTFDLVDRTQRMELIRLVMDEYVLAHAEITQAALDKWYDSGKKGERLATAPLNHALIDRLTDAVLDEELSDNTAWKSRHSEYPFLSEAQLSRRTDGVNQRKYEAGVGEVPLVAAVTYGTDGRNYASPKRRERSDNENLFIDEGIRVANKERKARYAEFTGVQPVKSYTLTPEELEAYRCR